MRTPSLTCLLRLSLFVLVPLALNLLSTFGWGCYICLRTKEDSPSSVLPLCSLPMCSFARVYKFLDVSPMYTGLLPSGHSWHSNFNLIIDIVPATLTSFLSFNVAGNAIFLFTSRCGYGVGLLQFHFVLPPSSIILNLMPPLASSAATFLIIFTSTPLGVVGTRMGAMCPHLVAQFSLLSSLTFFLPFFRFWVWILVECHSYDLPTFSHRPLGHV